MAGLLLARMQPTTYQVSSIVLVREGAPGTTYPGGPAGSPQDSLNEALNYAAEIPTRSVMQYVFKFDPELQKHGYTADDLILDVVPSTSTTAATISLLASATHPADAVLLADDVANGFASYIQVQSQQNLDQLRKTLTDQIASYQQQKLSWEQKIEALPNNQVPQYAVYNNNLTDVTHALDTLQGQLQNLPATVKGDVLVVQPATMKDVTTSLKGVIITAVAAVVGLLIGFLIMLLMIFLDNRLHSDAEVKEKLGMAYLGGLSNHKEIKDNPIRLTGFVAREVSDICVNLHLTGILPGHWKAPQGDVLLVTSPRAAEGKTSLTAAISATLARGGSKVVVIDGNLRHPSTHLVFGIRPAGVGLSGLLNGTGRESVDNAVVRSTIPGVWLLPVGAPLDDATILLEQKLPAILHQLRTKTDVIIIDGPALLSGADASILAMMVDGVALVIDARHEKVPFLLRAKDLLESLTHTPAGIIMNRLGRAKNHYYATAYSRSAAPDGWVPLQAYLTNGSQTGSGQRLEPVSTMRVIKAPWPVPPAQPSMATLSMPQPNAAQPEPLRGMQQLLPTHAAPHRVDMAAPHHLRFRKDE